MPLLFAEFVVWLGFGGLLPVLPLYFTEQGIDLSTLGLVIAAWPAARLVSEPIFGWLADRTARVPLMVIGLLATGIFGALPLFLTGPLAFLVLARPGRAERRALRPGRARLPHGRDPRGRARRGVRAVRGGPDGRPAARAGDRRLRRGELRRHRRSCSSSAPSPRCSPPWPSRCASGETPVRTHPAPPPDRTEFPPDPPSLAGRGRGRHRCRSHADRRRR